MLRNNKYRTLELQGPSYATAYTIWVGKSGLNIDPNNIMGNKTCQTLRIILRDDSWKSVEDDHIYLHMSRSRDKGHMTVCASVLTWSPRNYGNDG